MTEAKRELRELGKQYRSLPWRIGDAYLDLEAHIGERLPGIAVELGLSEYLLYDFVRMSQLWSREFRVFDLPWSYYRDAGGDVETAWRLLDAAVQNGWSRDVLRKARKKLKEHMDDYDRHDDRSSGSDPEAARRVEEITGEDVRMEINDVSNDPDHPSGDHHSDGGWKPFKGKR